MCRPTISRRPSVVDRHRDYRGHRDDAAALAHLEVGGVEPEIGPLAIQRALEERVHPLVDVLAQLGTDDFEMPLMPLDSPDDLADPHRHAHGLHQLVDAARRDAGDPGLLDDGDQRLLDGLCDLGSRKPGK